MTREHFPEHLGLKILVRLPVKSLVRFKSISKKYNALMRETSFVSEHLSRSMDKVKNKSNFLVFHQINKFCISLIVYDDEKSQTTLVEDLKPPFIFIPGVNNIIAHANSNGIIYLELLSGVPRNPNLKILWNPATREVYSLRSDSWKIVNVNVLARYIATPMFNAYVNGAYHWLAESDDQVEFVLCFDMSNDVFWKMNLPSKFEENKKFYIRHSNIVVLNDRVGYIGECMHSEIHFEIWTMNEYGVESSWVRMFNLVRGPCPEILLEFWKEDDVSVLGGEDYQPLVFYKIGEQHVVKELPLRLGIEHRAFRYVESVVPLSSLVHEEA